MKKLNLITWALLLGVPSGLWAGVKCILTEQWFGLMGWSAELAWMCLWARSSYLFEKVVKQRNEAMELAEFASKLLEQLEGSYERKEATWKSGV